jgi:hypothetical protein
MMRSLVPYHELAAHGAGRIQIDPVTGAGTIWNLGRGLRLLLDHEAMVPVQELVVEQEVAPATADLIAQLIAPRQLRREGGGGPRHRLPAPAWSSA